ncbi:hypothetical protein M434DRAFT_375966 [Hypoxylon sp. CO27-5]|nr:hypothetical protein M434DRAFT_375966 [Hypoxylon sp. CO27-5]
MYATHPNNNIMVSIEQVSLKAEMENKVIPCVEGFGGPGFLPKNYIEHVTTVERIEKVLTACGIPPQDDLVNFIRSHATKVFLLLVYCEKVDAIPGFMLHRFCDGDLPVASGWTERNTRIVRSLNEDSDNPLSRIWECFSDWKGIENEVFTLHQWLFLAPVFQVHNFDQRVHASRPLPFIATIYGYSWGNFSTVHHVTIPTTHLGFGGDENIAVAVKKFHNSDLKSFKKEVELLREIHNLKHAHLIEPIAAFENGAHLCVLFPWCDGGNLVNYWKQSNENPNNELISWTLLQMSGLCECLAWLSELNFRHGDLKPENILHKGGRENFLIADVGISKVHSEITERRYGGTSTEQASLRYAPPEYTANKDNHMPLSRDFDVWSMGVLLLEWLIRLSVYSAGLTTLMDIHTFWQKDEGRQVQVDPQCRRLMQEMGNIMEANAPNHCLKHLLDLIQERLLVVQLAKGGESRDRGRAKADELWESMEEIATNNSYGREPILWENGGITPELPEISYPSGGNSTITEDSFSSQQYTTIRPDRYDEPRPDNGFGRRILNDFNWGFLKPISSIVTLYSSCENVHIFFSSRQIPYNMSNLMASSRTCNLCALICQCLLDAGVKSTGVGRLVNKHSIIRDEATKPKIDTLHFAPLGFPQLPKPGSSEQLVLIREWLLNCDLAHECKPPPSPTGESRMPTRLLDVGTSTSPAIRLITTNGQPDSAYVALSHCWGNVPENLRFFTNRGNIRSHEEGIYFKTLPKTFQDAVTVTRGIGIQYLWIDSLCIIQQDIEDWGTNAGRMETVFSSAYCTIAASSASSYLEGFIHDRKDRPCVIIKKGDMRAYVCKYIDNFHYDVEQAVLNKRGWVLQERALSRRTIHFTSNQVYLECGDGVQCETLARLHNSKAEFLGDPNFPKSALQYFRDGRIVLFQTLYEMYSKLAFSVPTDRSMGILGLERRLAKTFDTGGDYGVLECYPGRSLIWKRECSDKLRRISYPDNCAVPSWSWMAYSGEISYVSAPFGGVSWNKEQLHIPFGEDRRLRNTTHMLTGKPEPMIRAPVTNINMEAYGDEILQRLIFDEVTVDDLNALRCVVLGNDKEGDQDTRCYYVIVIQSCCCEACPKHVYKRVGAGSLLKRHISTVPNEYISIR